MKVGGETLLQKRYMWMKLFLINYWPSYYIFQALCNCDIQESHFSETELQVILLRYSMHLIPGLGSGIWICTPKTFKIWSRVFPCKRKIQRRYVIIVKELYQTQPKFVIRLYYLLKILQSLLEILLVKEKYILDLMEYLRSLWPALLRLWKANQVMESQFQNLNYLCQSQCKKT